MNDDEYDDDEVELIEKHVDLDAIIHKNNLILNYLARRAALSCPKLKFARQGWAPLFVKSRNYNFSIEVRKPCSKRCIVALIGICGEDVVDEVSRRCCGI